MSYCGSETINEMQKKVKFIRMTPRGFEESGVHDIK
jgi:IMP dehydrogenase